MIPCFQQYVTSSNTGPADLTVWCLGFVWHHLQVAPLIQKVNAHYRILVFTDEAYVGKQLVKSEKRVKTYFDPLFLL